MRWYAAQKRDLPWRNTRDPYRILISEVMLQQTRVAAVAPYYERFLERFPTVESLARADQAEALAAWAGLGYYSRARNLLQAAREIATAGRFPSSYAGIRALPGVGQYTAAAVSSIAFGLPHAAVDGNARRVLGRVFPDGCDPERLLERKDPGAWNQALMELGATVCLPRAPRCADCPLTAVCAKAIDVAPSKERRFERIPLALLVIRRGRCTLMRPSPRVAASGNFPKRPPQSPAPPSAPTATPSPTAATKSPSISGTGYEIPKLIV